MRLAGIAAILVLAAYSADTDYVDARVCATCHRQIAESYRQTGMGRSFFRPTAANTVEDYGGKNEFYHALSDTHFAMVRREGAFLQRRWQMGFDGKETNIEEATIDYVIGSGNHSRTYLHRTPRGTLIELPLSWYSEKGGTWGMSPSFDSRHPLTRRVASYECIFCHDAYPQTPAGHDTSDAAQVFSGALPEGIDCQRCHGPGGKHVRVVRTAGSKAEDVRASIVNPARLSPKLRMDVCLQCHLEPTSTAIPSLIRRFDRGPFTFRPGEPLENFELAFDHAPGKGYDDKFEIVGSSAYRLRKSRCFLESKGALTCDMCHDPHSVPRGEEAVKHYATVCRQCHAPAIDTAVAKGAHPAGSDCVSCHMAKRRTEDVVRVMMTDHLIARRPPPGDLLADIPERHPAESEKYHGEVVPYYPAAPGALYRSAAQVMMGNNLERGLPDLDRELRVQQPRVADWYLVLGDGWQASGKPTEAAAAYERAVRLKPDSVRALLSLAAAWKGAGKMPATADLIARAIQAAPADARVWFQAGMLDRDGGRIGDAIEKVKKAISLDPDLPEAFTGLAELLGRAGQAAAAGAALREALRMDPYDSTAWDLGGRMLVEASRLPEALFDFERANQYRPDFPPHLYDYALALAAANRAEDAEKSVDAALRLEPAMVEAHLLRARLLVAKRLLPDTAQEYRVVLQLRPDMSRVNLDLAQVLAAMGDMPGAVEALRTAAQGADPEAARLARQALERLGQH